jgi:hypothetical protein
MDQKKHRLFGIYLPQFHPLPENDRFWGKGFTEWHNVVTAKPLFKGHYQPHIPSEMGFYDLRVAETMQQQSELAEEHGLDGFIFYHYWFNGKPLMEKPLEIYRHLNDSKLPYFFCWANENWSRRWDGSDTEVLLHQDYTEQDDELHFNFFLPYFADSRYTKINGCPVIALYRPKAIPYLKKWAEKMKALAQKNGYPGLYLIYVINRGIDAEMDIEAVSFDAALVFQPSWAGGPAGGKRVGLMDKAGKLLQLLHIRKNLPLNYLHELVDYRTYMKEAISYLKKKKPFKTFYSIFPMWDNSARRKKGGGKIFIGSTPELFQEWLEASIKGSTPYSAEENLLVINAWNEWAEGNHLEPCQKWERAYLSAIKNANKHNFIPAGTAVTSVNQSS